MATCLQLLGAALPLIQARLAAPDRCRLAASLLAVLRVSYADLRDDAAALLAAHCTASEVLAAAGTRDAAAFFSAATGLATQAAGRACDPGATQCRLGLRLLCLRGALAVAWDSTAHALTVYAVPASPVHAAMSTITALVAAMASQLAAAQHDVATAARNAPVHGLAGSVALCWGEMTGVALPAECRDAVRQAAAASLQAALDITAFAMGLLGMTAGGDDDDEMPSFSDMHVALDGAAPSSVARSDHVELLLSMCWQCVEQATGIIAAVFCVLPLPGTADDLVSVGELTQCVATIVTCLRTCRHRGVVEACSDALARIARRVLRSAQTSLYEIFFQVARDCIALVEDSTAGAFSVTRRSAGLPAIVLAVVVNPTANVRLPYRLSRAGGAVIKPGNTAAYCPAAPARAIRCIG